MNGLKVLVFETGIATEIARDILISFCKHWGVPCALVSYEGMKNLEKAGYVERDTEGYVVLSEKAKAKAKSVMYDITIDDVIYILIQDDAKVLDFLKVLLLTERQRQTFELILEKFTKILEALD